MLLSERRMTHRAGPDERPMHDPKQEPRRKARPMHDPTPDEPVRKARPMHDPAPGEGRPMHDPAPPPD